MNVRAASNDQVASEGDESARESTLGVSAALFSAMRREMEMVILPELQSAYGKLAAVWICETLDYLLLQAHDDPEITRQRAAVLASLASGDQTRSAYRSGEWRQEDAVALIAASVRGMGNAMSAASIAAIGEITVRAIAAEREFIERNRIASIRCLEALEVQVTPERLNDYFDSTSEFAGYRTKSLVRMVGGYSRDTFIISTATPSGVVADFALRRDLPFGPIESSAADEYGYLERLRAVGIPVPRPRAAVRDRSIMGESFLITDRVPGCTAADAMAADRAAGEAGARELARILAQLHQVEPEEIGLRSASRNPGAQVNAMIEYWRARWDRYRSMESDAMEAAFVWLQSNLPEHVERSVVVHGDFRPGNAMMHEGRITAILDWELIHTGDAAEDVEYMKLFVRPFLDPEEFLAEYLAAGGVRYDIQSARFYEIFRSVRNVVCTDTSWYGFLQGLYPSMRLSYQGTTSRRMLLGMLGEALKSVNGVRRQ